MPIPCPTCEAPFLLQKETKKRGEFYKCLECKSEMSPETIEAETGATAGDAASME